MAIFFALSVFVTGLVFVFVLLQYGSLRDSIDLGGPMLSEGKGTPLPKVRGNTRLQRRRKYQDVRPFGPGGF